MSSIISSPLSVREVSGVTVGTFPAEVDVANASVIGDRLLGLLDAGAGPLILDLTTTRFCDCAGVGAILRVERRAVALRTPACLALPPGGPVRRIAAVTGLTERFLVTASVAEARSAFGLPLREDTAAR
jgi:anti-anti-sigma factor